MRCHVLVGTFIAVVLLMSRTEESFATELRAARGWFEQGDFILAQGLQLAVINDNKQSVRFEFTGRTFGGFTEATGIVSANLPYQVLPWTSVTTTYGLSFMDEYTAYDSPHGKDEALHSLNLGINLGLAWTVIETGRWNATLEWNSHIFAAGVAFLYLTTARKTNFSAGVGYRL